MAVTQLGFGILGVAPVLAVVVVFQGAAQDGQLRPGPAGPGGAVHVLPRTDKFKAKNFNDTSVYRFGDQVRGADKRLNELVPASHSSAPDHSRILSSTRGRDTDLPHIGILYTMEEKPIDWVGRSLEDLRAFPGEARREAGHDLFLVQRGESPRDWKPMQSVGAGAREIRIRSRSGGRVDHRVVYVAKFAEAVYVLHAFRKTTPATSGRDLEIARRRYREMLEQREKGSWSHG